MSSGGEIAFVALHGVVKFLDSVFWVLGKGLLATLCALIGFVARLIMGDDAVKRGRRDFRERDEGGGDVQTVPRRIKEAAKGDMRKQREKHVAWLKWRKDFDVEHILDTPKPAFEVIKAWYPHALHKKTRGGFAIQLEMPGQFSALLEELRKRGFEDPTKTVVEHVSFVMCYVFANVEPRDLPNGRLLRIVDMSRMDTRDTSYEAFMFLKAMASMVSVAFPERVHRVVIVNPPIVFGLIWSVFSPMASQATLARVRICQTTEEARQTLSEDLDLCDIPREYGGECDCGNNKRGSRSGGGTRKRFSVEGRGRRGRTPMHCPIAQCSDCWRHSELEQDLWDRISELNGGLVGIDAQKQTGAKGSTRGRPRSSRRPKKQGEGTFGLVKGEEGEDCDGSSKRRTRSVMSDSEVSELSDSAQSWFW